MDRQAIISEVSGVVRDYLNKEGFELVDVIYRHEGRDLFLRILADRPMGGITIEECVQLNRQISVILDEKNMLQQRYILEVSSPGLDRPLKNKADFIRCINREVKFFLNEAVEGKIEIDGLIRKVEEDTIEIEAKGAIIKIAFNKINKAKQIISGI